MQTIELLYVAFSLTLTAAGLSMVGFAIRAYNRTSRRAMFHLSVGFSLIVAAAIATTVSAFLTEFERTRTLLSVNYLITTVGYLFVIYSIAADQ
ncbi:hypothetical protein NGM10_15455 [Halorussus salilacus]|uniref:DUF7521 family protein n=1 Tax=Halorussus salilacus TaxID=2953750 RepID=UPI00209C70BA|nr:hypothetical protein [Halorussus salilacus]USZ68114.1 hypothetical protein NGM10_15455 [Halorussus salilacus]